MRLKEPHFYPCDLQLTAQQQEMCEWMPEGMKPSSLSSCPFGLEFRKLILGVLLWTRWSPEETPTTLVLLPSLQIAGVAVWVPPSTETSRALGLTAFSWRSVEELDQGENLHHKKSSKPLSEVSCKISAPLAQIVHGIRNKDSKTDWLRIMSDLSPATKLRLGPTEVAV